MQRLCLKSQLFLYFVNKSTYPVAVLYSLLFASSSGRSNGISASYRSVWVSTFFLESGNFINSNRCNTTPPYAAGPESRFA